MYCICCKQPKIFPDNNYVDEGSTEEELLWKKETVEMEGQKIPYTINNSMVNGGIIHIIDAGYGSKHDGDRFIIAICDDCIKENLEDSTLLYFDNYMFKGDGWVGDEIENSKKKYRRRKNLDNLTSK